MVPPAREKYDKKWKRISRRNDDEDDNGDLCFRKTTRFPVEGEEVLEGSNVPYGIRGKARKAVDHSNIVPLCKACVSSGSGWRRSEDSTQTTYVLFQKKTYPGHSSSVYEFLLPLSSATWFRFLSWKTNVAYKTR